MISNDSQTEVCANCGEAGAHVRYVTRSFGHGDTLLVIENVPLVSCPACGESYFTAQTLHAIERIKRDRGAVAVAKLVPVAEFAG